MKLQNIELNGLFGKFDYKISLNQREHITIVVGPNGSGKTTIFRILHAVFSGQYSNLADYTFHRLKLYFSDNSEITIYYHLYHLLYDYIQNDQNISFFTNRDIKTENYLYFKYYKANDLLNYSLFKLEKDGFLQIDTNENYPQLQEKVRSNFLNIYSNVSGLNQFKKEFFKERNNPTNRDDILSMLSFIEARHIFTDWDHYLSRNSNVLRDAVLSKIKPLYLRIFKDDYHGQTDYYFENKKFKKELLALFRLNKILNKKPVKCISDDDIIKSEPLVLKTIRNNIPIHFIESQRLFYSKAKKPSKGYILSINQCSQEIQKQIRLVNEDYAATYKKLNESFQYRFKQKLNENFIPKQIIYPGYFDEAEEWSPLSISYDKYWIFFNDTVEESEFEEKKILDFNLFESSTEISKYPSFRPKLNDYEQAVYNTQLVDDWYKLSRFFQHLKTRNKIFQNIISHYIPGKYIIFSEKYGISFFDTKTNEQYSYQNLSSGEQHAVILFFNLLFKVENDSLILIDEPEISWHISWQRQFVECLKRVIKEIPMEILISTHSPSIVYDRWDLAVELDSDETAVN